MECQDMGIWHTTHRLQLMVHKLLLTIHNHKLMTHNLLHLMQPLPHNHLQPMEALELALLQGRLMTQMLRPMRLLHTVFLLAMVFGIQYTNLYKAGVHDKVPDSVSAKVTDAKGQVSAAVNSVDSSLCSGLDKLVDKVPALKQETPELYNSTKSSVGSYAFMATTYVASFTLVSYALKFSDFGMDGADRILKMIPGEKTQPLLSGLHWVRDEAAVVRQEGARRNGSERVLALENASLLEVLAGL